MNPVLVKLLKLIFPTILNWVAGKIVELMRRLKLIKTGEKFIEKTNQKVAEMEKIIAEAKEEIKNSGDTSDETKEALRNASRDLVRGKRDGL